MAKIELLLDTDQKINDLVQAFEQCTLDLSHWTHRAHLAVGAYYARTLPRDEALNTMRIGIQRYNSAHDNPTGYNETITRLFLAKMAADLETGVACPLLVDEVTRLTSICNIEWLYRYYSRALLHSPTAKSQWVAPDLQPLDFAVEK